MIFSDGTPNVRYNSSHEWYGAWNKLRGQNPEWNPEDTANLITQYGDQFSSLFKNYVGRDPSGDEVAKFYGQVVTPNGRYADQQQLRDRTATFVGDTFQQEAQQQAQSILEGQKAEAGRLSDLYRTQGQASIATVEGRLKEYQASLFEKLRPQLITSLQAQGLLNTGALNQSIAGAQKDLADQSSNFLTSAYLDNENQANAIKFGGEAAPYQYKAGMAQNMVGTLQQAGIGGLQNAYNTQASQNQYQMQLGLMREQSRLAQEAQPGFGRTFTQSLAGSMGNGLGNFFNPQTYTGAKKAGAPQ